MIGGLDQERVQCALARRDLVDKRRRPLRAPKSRPSRTPLRMSCYAEIGKLGHYSITFGTPKNPCFACGAWRVCSVTLARDRSAGRHRPRRRAGGACWRSPPSSARFRPFTSTSPSCSIQPRILLSSGTIALDFARRSSAMRARRCDLFLTVALSTDMGAAASSHAPSTQVQRFWLGSTRVARKFLYVNRHPHRPRRSVCGNNLGASSATAADAHRASCRARPFVERARPSPPQRL